jgi:hypothetical protein
MRRRLGKRWGWLALGLVVLALAACATIGIRQVQLSQALKFSHERHVKEADCGDCHGEVAKSTGSTLGKFIPVEHKACVDCHDEAKQGGKCDKCHLTADRKVKLTRLDRHLNFSHAKHDKVRVKDGCKACHGKAYVSKAPGENLVPDMAQCAEACHKKDLQQQSCEMCHKDLKRYRLEPIGLLSHTGNFVKRHGTLARNTGACLNCHDQTHCADCHARTAAMPLSIRFPEKVEARFIHRGDFLGRHAREAQVEPATCRKCHGSKHCSSCHELQGLVSPPIGTSKTSTGTRKVHGPDFMTPGTPGFHGRHARRDINKCASCHDQGGASNCITCHKVGALGGNPHPPNFKWRNKTNECRANRMCATCHIGGTGCP